MKNSLRKAKESVIIQTGQLIINEDFKKARRNVRFAKVMIVTMLFIISLTSVVFASSPLDVIFELFDSILDPIWTFLEKNIVKVFAVSIGITCLSLILFPNARKAMVSGEKLKYITMAFIGFFVIGAVITIVSKTAEDNDTLYTPE